MKQTDPEEIGHYKILKRIGKGGMGEVFLAYDPICERNVALKCIRNELREKKAIRARFLKEARITSQLTHPSIVPIYSIHAAQTSLYYTMPYVEGPTLRQILRQTKEKEKKGVETHPIGGSIPALCQVFLRICEGVSYTHAKTILHRDLKPENIITGQYGKVLILDWGIADYTKRQKEGTKTGKVAGTVAYMAPERALGKKATYQTDIYSLGVILYQMLTLELPFQRGNLEAFRKYMKEEKYINPIELAPYREIPHELLEIVEKCLSFPPENRYQSVEELIKDMRSAIEGKACWMLIASLDPKNKKDWEFQEHVMLAEHTAITRHTDIAQWAALMISKQHFSGNIRLNSRLKLKEKSAGIGIVFGVPELPTRTSLREGYCLWISPGKIQLLRSNVVVIDIENSAKQDIENHIIIEKTHDCIRCFFNDILLFTYKLSLPLTGAHVGLIHKDLDFSLTEFSIYSGSQSVMVNCLAVPDAFSAYRHYKNALLEYRHIAAAFPGRKEGSIAIFKAGITLLELAKLYPNQQEQFHLQALDEFESLRGTSGAPLGELGKSLAYKAGKEYEEEAKCLELALNKYAKHPLLPRVEEHIVYRMHESTTQSRKAAYKILLLVVRYLPNMLDNKEANILITSLQKNWQELFFIEKYATDSKSSLAIILSFWTDTKQALLEIIQSLLKTTPCEEVLLENALFALSELGYYSDVRNLLKELQNKSALHCKRGLSLLKCTILQEDSAIKNVFAANKETCLDLQQVRVLVHIIKKLLLRKEYGKIEKIFNKIPENTPKDLRTALDAGFLWSFLLENKLHKAKSLLRKYPLEELQNDHSPLFSSYAVFILHTENKQAMYKHFRASLEKPNPPTTALLSYFLQEKIREDSTWMQEAFYWEKQELLLELVLFYRATNERKKAKEYEKRLAGRYTKDYQKKPCA